MAGTSPEKFELIYTEAQARDIDYDVIDDIEDIEDTTLEGEALMLFILRAVEDWNGVKFEDEAFEYFESHYEEIFDI